jgi:hypothetical protein
MGNEVFDFGHPARNNEESDELVKLCVQFYGVKSNGEFVLLKFGETSKAFGFHRVLQNSAQTFVFSVRPMHHWQRSSMHLLELCSTLGEMAPYVEALSISCEADNSATSHKQRTRKKAPRRTLLR